MTPPVALPHSLQRRFQGYAWQRITIGESRANTFRLTASQQPDFILKTLVRDPLQTLRGEAERTRWLHERAPVPEVIDFIQDSACDYLLMSALAGQDAATATLEPEKSVNLLADALRELHGISISGCPFHYSDDDGIAEAKAIHAAGRVNTSNFDPENLGRDPGDLLAEIVALRPMSQKAVFTHGDYCLPNVIISGGQFSGFVDLGRAGVGDPYRDLALVGRSLDRNLGPGWAGRFFTRYGLAQPDPVRLRYFRLLDEFL